jgi:Family of unknown function (DUF6603)
MSSLQYVGEVLSAFADVFQPLEDSVGTGQAFSSFLAEFGWTLDPKSDANAILTALGQLPSLVNALQDAADAFNAADSGGQSSDVSGTIAKLTPAIIDLITLINNLANATPDSTWPSPLNTQEFWQAFPLQMVDFLLYRYLQDHSPKLFACLVLIGVITEKYSIPFSATGVPYTKRNIEWDRLIPVITEPQNILKNVYGWGGSFDVHRLMDNLLRVALAFQLEAGMRAPSEALLNVYFDPAAPHRNDAYELAAPVHWEMTEVGDALVLMMLQIGVLPIPPKDNLKAAPVGLAIYPIVSAGLSETIQITDSVSITIKGDFVSDGFIRAEIRPAGVDIAVDPALVGQIDTALTINAQPPTPWIPLGHPSSSRLEIRHAHASLKAKGAPQDLEFIIEAAADDIALIIQFDEGDGFLRQILGDTPKTISLSLGITWSSKHGVQLSGQAKLEVTIPVNVTIADVIDFDSITLGAGVSASPPGVSLAVSVTGGLEIGPVSATVDRVGVAAILVFAQAGQTPGNLGNVDLTWKFLPPKGLGLSIDAGPVSGGGYISFDEDKGEYAGILQLTLPILSITVIGLLDTILPGGKKGFSFLLIVACDFPPIQLGYGFILTGLGGLAGINRSIVVQALQDGVHSGAVNDILFPEDPIAHAPQLISDLETIFPPTQDEYVFGPMVELGWGEPDPIITGELGIILILPNPLVIVLLGKLEVSLPEPDSPVVDLRMEIAGSIDFTGKLFEIDTTLRDSHVLAFSIEGDTSFRLSYGATPNFAFAMGGMNPHFQPPPKFPILKRLSISLSTGDNPRLALDTYLAVTPNTIQVGAKAELNVKYGDFKAAGDLGFDALFHFSPFSFEIDVEADIAVNGPAGFSASVHLDAELTGMDPFRCQGTLVIDFIGKHKFPIDIPLGQPVTQAPTPLPDPWTQLKADIGLPGNWSASVPQTNQRAVVLAMPKAASGQTFVDPAGSLTLQQKTAPFDRALTKFGAAALTTPVQFSITAVTAGTVSFPLPNFPLQPSLVPFAAAQFEQMSDAEKLSRPSFEPMNGGVSIGGDAIAFGATLGRDYGYTTVVVDEPAPANRYRMSAAVQIAGHLNGPGTKAPAATRGMGKYGPPAGQPAAATLSRAQYVIADVSTLQVATQILGMAPGGAVPTPNPPEKGAMMSALSQYYKKAPAQRGKYAVMGSWELL